MNGKWMIAALSGLCMLLGDVGSAAAATPPVRDREYTVIEPAQPPLEPLNGKKVEVIEFFYYGCPHCYNLQPSLKAWLKNAPSDVEFRRQPTVFRESWIPLTRTFYALDAIGLLDKFHDEVFETVHKQNVNLGNRQILLDWAGRRGIDTKKLAEAYDSFSVQTKSQRAVQMTRA